MYRNLPGAAKYLFVVVAVLFWAGYAQSEAASPVPFDGIIINWSANTYAPPLYHGKRLPTSETNITAWATVFAGGKSVDASNYSIQWYTDSDILRSGAGLTSISFSAPKTTSQIINLQARTQTPKGALLVSNIQIPIVNPVVTIEADYPGGVFSGSTANAKALPYFFNVSDLSALVFKWSANGVAAQNAENPDSVAINLDNRAASGMAVRIDVSASNPNDSTAATAFADLTYQRT